MSELVEILLRLRGSRQFQSEADKSAKGIGKVGTASVNAEKKAGVFGKTMKTVAGHAKLAGVAVGAFAGVAAVKSVQAASDLSEEVNKTGVVFGKSSKDVLAWSKNSATGFGQSRQQALEATGVFGNMLVPMGFARGRAADMSKGMVGLAGDMASFNNASPEETLDALRAGLAGESEPLRRFGVFLNDARLKQEAASKGLYKGKGPLNAHAKAVATYGLILKDTKDAQGDFQRTSGGLANQQRILKARITDLSASIGKALLPYVQKGIQALNKFLTGIKNNTGWGGKFRRALQALGTFITGTLVPAFLSVVGFVKNWIASFKQGKTWIVIATSALAGLVAGIIAYKTVVTVITAVTRLWAIAQGILNAVMALSPIGLIIAAVVALGVAFFIAYKKSRTFRNIVNAVWDTMKSVASWLKGAGVAAWHVFSAAMKNLPLIWVIRHFKDIISFIRGLPGKIAKAASGMWDGIKNAFKSTINWIIRGWNGLRFGIPGFDPPGPGKFKGFSVGVPQIPMLGDGGLITRGGAAIVGDRGPELVRLPRAAEVIPNNALAGAAGAAGQTIVTQVFLDRRQIAEAVGTYASDRIARR